MGITVVHRPRRGRTRVASLIVFLSYCWLVSPFSFHRPIRVLCLRKCQSSPRATLLPTDAEDDTLHAEQRLRVPSLLSNIENSEDLNELERLRRENELLKQAVEELEGENERLHRNSRIVLESFEGEGKLRGDDIDIYNDSSLWCDELEDGACPLEPTVSFGQALRDRAYWLVGLLILQSLSGFILSRNEALIEDHPFIIFFLTMLVGAGGNAGNQASVRVIRGLALETLNPQTQSAFLLRELKMAGALSAILALGGFLRASLFHTPFAESLAVTVSLAMIVFTSVCLGAVLPLVLKRIGVDPAHSSTSIQVIMDILGVFMAVYISRLLLDSPLGHLIVATIGG